MNTDHLQKLTLDKLDRIAGGQVADALDASLVAVLTDMRRRPENRSARKVVLTISINPSKSGRHAEIRCEAKPVIPGRAAPAAAIVVKLDKQQDPQVLFNPCCATHLDQLPIDFGPGTGAGKA